MSSILMVFIVFVSCTYAVHGKKDWWETSAFYQIYPRSFKDSNGDGIGDLNGITEKLPYLKEIGVNATWLSPIFKSPMADFGYDISDFFTIQPEYGTIEDFRRLLSRAKELDIRIILDFVPNHSSDECEWFIRSAKRDPEFKDFYVWHPGYPNPINPSNRLPPNNWMSVFRKGGWEWNEVRQEFYFHQFHRKQPDLNYRNPLVVEVMKEVLRYWLEQGVDGFRIDAVPHLFEVKPDANGNYPDEPVSGLTADTDDANYLLHIYTQDQEETIDMVYQWRETLEQFRRDHGGESRVMLTESYSKMEVIKRYFGDGKGRNGSHMPFNFQLINNLNRESNAVDFKRIIDLWNNNLPSGRTANWVIGNHDQKRVASRLGENRIDGISIIIQTMPGVSITYNGEEIGMTDVHISWEDTVDPPACNSNATIYESLSRDPARTPFQWDDSANAGFSDAKTTWLPVSPLYKEVNVEVQEAAERSHLHVYKALTKLRQTETMKNGNTTVVTLNNNVLSITRKNPYNGQAYISVVNLNGNNEIVVLNDQSLPAQLKVVVASVSSSRNVGDLVAKNSLSLAAYESLILSNCLYCII